MFQADPPGIQAVFAPLVGVAAIRVVLPELGGAVVGRDVEVASVVELIGQRRFLTLTGTGGSGKTTLATVVAARVAHEFPGGVYFVDLVPVADVRDIGLLVATTLEATELAEDPWDAVAAAAEKAKLLLVLDNCESHPGLADILGGEGSSAMRWAHVLATSRLPVGIPNEVVVPVLSLATPDGTTRTTAQLRAAPAGDLLLTRALEARPGLVVDEETADHLGAIARRLDGMPLALELAAARFRLQPVAELRASLDSSLAGLVDVTGRHPSRHRALGEVLAWSIDHLDAEARDLLSVMACFAASPDLAAIAGVAGASVETVLTPLSHLLDANLVRAVELGDGTPRFTLLMPVREHVRSGNSADLREELADRHVTYHRNWAREGSQTRYNTDRDLEWIEEARAMRGDALRALERVMGVDPVAAIEYATHLGVIWYDLGDNARCVEVIDELVAATGPEADPYRTAARLYRWMLLRDNETEIEEIALRAIEIDAAGVAAVALMSQGSMKWYAGAREESANVIRAAHSWAERAVTIEKDGVRPLDGLTRGVVIGSMLEYIDIERLRWKEPARAIELAGDAYRRSLRTMDPGVRANGVALAELLAASGKLDEADRVLGQLESMVFAANASHHLARGMVQMRRGELQESVESFATELTITPSAGLVSQCRVLMADAFLLLSDPQEALRQLGNVDDAPLGVRRAGVHVALARVQIALGEVDAAILALDTAASGVVMDEAAPGTLTYLLTRAFTSPADQRLGWVQAYDDLVVATGALPWPREAADRASLG